MDKYTILIVGASSGIGLATTKIALERGAKVLATGRNVESLIQLQLLYKEKLEIFNVHLESEDSLFEFFNALENKEDISGFVFSAGISPTLPLLRERKENLIDTMNINVFSCFQISNLLIKKYRDTLKSIVYISSVMGKLGDIGKGNYAMSKASLESMARVQALENAKHKIRINTIAPGVVNTPLSNKSHYRSSSQALKIIEDRHPLGLGEANDVAEAALFLLSDASRWITGTTLTVDGGYSIQ